MDKEKNNLFDIGNFNTHTSKYLVYLLDTWAALPHYKTTNIAKRIHFIIRKYHRQIASSIFAKTKNKNNNKIRIFMYGSRENRNDWTLGRLNNYMITKDICTITYRKITIDTLLVAKV
jgi:hypothetical protein